MATAEEIRLSAIRRAQAKKDQEQISDDPVGTPLWVKKGLMSQSEQPPPQPIQEGLDEETPYAADYKDYDEYAAANPQQLPYGTIYNNDGTSSSRTIPYELGAGDKPDQSDLLGFTYGPSSDLFDEEERNLSAEELAEVEAIAMEMVRQKEEQKVADVRQKLAGYVGDPIASAATKALRAGRDVSRYIGGIPASSRHQDNPRLQPAELPALGSLGLITRAPSELADLRATKLERAQIMDEAAREWKRRKGGSPDTKAGEGIQDTESDQPEAKPKAKDSGFHSRFRPLGEK